MSGKDDDELKAVQDLMDIACCQFCGRAAAIDQEVVNTWLISPKRGENPLGELIVRCPHHISEWAMRNSTAGRTKRMRERARTGRTLDLPVRRSFDPLPARFRGAVTKPNERK